MSYLRNLIDTVFSVEVGSSDSRIISVLEQIRENPDVRQLNGLKNEIEKLIEDEDSDWMSYMEGEYYEVNEVLNNQEEAKNFVIRNIWIPLFEIR